MRGVDRFVDTVRCFRIHAVGEVIAILSCEQLLGLEDTHVVALDAAWCLGDCRLHPLTVQALARLRADAREAGFDLRVVSGFRSFERQAAIWNAKASGLRPVLDAAERPIDTSTLDDAALLFAILRWSALPGASRHHWGTDVDLNELENRHFEKGGKHEKTYGWLVTHAHEYGFCQPYTAGRPSGYHEEKWHWSYMPLSKPFLEQYEKNIRDADIKGFKGAETAAEIGIVKNYVLGINHACQ